MNRTEIYLSVLGKLMQEEAVQTVPTLTAEYEKLYNAVNASLHDFLTNTCYPDAPILLEEINRLIAPLEGVLLCPELLQKAVYHIRGSAPVVTLLNIGNVIGCSVPERLSKIWIDVPVVLTDGETEVSAMTYAGRRIELTLEELEMVYSESRSRHFQLNQIIRYLILKLPLQQKDIAFVLDTRLVTAKGYFYNVIDHEINFLKGVPNSNLIKYLNRHNNRPLLVADALLPHISQLFPSHHCVPLSAFQEWMKQNTGYTYQGLRERCIRALTKLETFYYQQIKQEETLSVMITNDLIWIGGNHETLSHLRKDAENRCKALRQEDGRLHQILTEIRNTCSAIEQQLGKTMYRCSGFSQDVVDCVLEMLFLYAESGMMTQAKECAKRLEQMQYPDMELVKQYFLALEHDTLMVMKASASRTDTPQHWASAKMMIAAAEIRTDAMHIQKLREWCKTLGSKRISTGKEKYALALISAKEHGYDIRLLKDSYAQGFQPAGQLLFNMHGTSEEQYRMWVFLSKWLHTGALCALGDQKMKTETRRGYVLESEAMMYYKLGAAQGDLTCIGRIVDVVYERVFQEMRYIDLNERNTMLAEIMVELCEYLCSCHHYDWHYSEIMGVGCFLLKQYSQSMKLLSGKASPQAYYCKGWMKANGAGTSKEPKQAISYYEKAGSFRDAARRANAIQKEIHQQEQSRQKHDEQKYDENREYTGTSNSSESSSSRRCFVTTAVMQSLGKADDCEELEMMRRFRDEYLIRNQEGESLVTEYYRIAPEIIQRINTRADANQIYHTIWESFLRPSLNALHEGNKPRAEQLYIQMVKQLAERYDVPIAEHILHNIQTGIS